MARTYHRDSKGRFAKRGGGGGGRSPISFIPGSALSAPKKATRASATTVKKTSVANNAVVQTLGGGTITRAEAAAIMFGTSRKKPKAKSKRRR